MFPNKSISLAVITFEPKLVTKVVNSVITHHTMSFLGPFLPALLFLLFANTNVDQQSPNVA
jgi:hypothetical protein